MPRIDCWRLCYTLLDTDGLAVLENCTDVIDSIPKLMRDEKKATSFSSTSANRFGTPFRQLVNSGAFDRSMQHHLM